MYQLVESSILAVSAAIKLLPIKRAYLSFF